MATIFLDRQHTSSKKRDDQGASYDLNGDGKISSDEQEARLTAFYLLFCELALARMGHRVVCLSDGSYPERHTRVNNEVSEDYLAWPHVYVAAHLNSGGGNYGSAFYDRRSSKGMNLAKHICDAVRQSAPELSNVKIIAAYDDRGSSPDPWLFNPFYTIKGVGSPVAICFEPFFIDNKDHAPLATRQGLERIGEALAVGIDNWIKTVL